MVLRQSIILDNEDVFFIIKRAMLEKGYDVANLTWEWEASGRLKTVQVNLCDQQQDVKI